MTATTEKVDILGYKIDENRLSIDDCFAAASLKKRILILSGNICSETIRNIIITIHAFNNEDSGTRKEDRRPIILLISSPGGNVLDSFSLIGTIIHSITPVWTVNIGYCFSMAFHVFVCGEKRFAYPSSVFLLHDGQTGNFDSTLKLQDYAGFEKRYRNTLMLNNILDHTSITEEEYRQNERMEFEWYMFANEAQRYDILDYIINEQVSIYELAENEKFK